MAKHSVENGYHGTQNVDSASGMLVHIFDILLVGEEFEESFPKSDMTSYQKHFTQKEASSPQLDAYQYILGKKRFFPTHQRRKHFPSTAQEFGLGRVATFIMLPAISEAPVNHKLMCDEEKYARCRWDAARPARLAASLIRIKCFLSRCSRLINRPTNGVLCTTCDSSGGA